NHIFDQDRHRDQSARDKNDQGKYFDIRPFIGDTSSQPISKTETSQDHTDQTRPDIRGRPDEWRDDPRADDLIDHEDRSAREDSCFQDKSLEEIENHFFVERWGW